MEQLERLAQRDVLIEQLRTQLAAAQQRIARVGAPVGAEPRNSDRPPSSEELAKPAPGSLRRRSGRKPGGQPEHPGSTLRQAGRPDVVLGHEPKACLACGDGLAGAAEVGSTRRQVFEIPPMRARVTEHQMVTRRCGCGICTTAAAGEVDQDVNGPVPTSRTGPAPPAFPQVTALL